MKKKLDSHRVSLIAKVVIATTQQEVLQYCNAAIQELEGQQLHGHLIVRFLENTVSELTAFSPSNQNSQQWSNIINAKVFCNRLLKEYSFSYE